MSKQELEISGRRFREMVEQVLERVVPFLDTLPEQPGADVEGGTELARSLLEPVPTQASSFESLLDLLFERLIPKSFNTAGPGYLAYIPGGGLPESSVAELISTAVNRYVGVFAAAPALVQLESNVVRWFCEIVGYPDEARGYLSSGGSLANFGGIVTARRSRLGDDFGRATIYCSNQVHHSVTKAAILAGFSPGKIRSLPVDAEYRLQPNTVWEAVSRDRQSGLQPFLLVGSAGTTNTGAVDPLHELADLADREGLWFHVDGAYGAFFNMTERGRKILRGLSRCDSLSLDPHKALFLPYGTGCLLVRNGQLLRQAHSQTGDYMPPLQEDPLLVDFCEYSPELSRSFRGLQVWLPFKLHGIQAFRQQLDEKLDLTHWLFEELSKLPHLELVAWPHLTVIALRYVEEGLSLEELDRRNREFLERILARKHVHLNGTVLDGKYVIRVCILSFRTHRDRLEIFLEDLKAALEEVRERLPSRVEQEHG